MSVEVFNHINQRRIVVCNSMELLKLFDDDVFSASGAFINSVLKWWKRLYCDLRLFSLQSRSQDVSLMRSRLTFKASAQDVQCKLRLTYKCKQNKNHLFLRFLLQKNWGESIRERPHDVYLILIPFTLTENVIRIHACVIFFPFEILTIVVNWHLHSKATDHSQVTFILMVT